MLPEEVRSSLAAVGDQSKGAVRLLEAAGMRFLHHIDPFDGGPYYGALVSDLEPVKAFKRLKAAPGDPADSSTFFLVARDDGRGFRAIRSGAKIVPSKIYLPAENLRALRIEEGDVVDVVPLP